MPKDEKNPTHGLDLEPVGFSGLKESGGQIDEEFLVRLKGDKGVKTYREMADNSSTVGAILFIIEALVRQVEWRVEASGESPEAKSEAEFLEGCLLDMSLTFEDVISEVLSFLTYGWSYFELVYKLRKGETDDPTTNSQFDDGRIGWRKIALRSQDTLDNWEFSEEDGGLEGMHQLTEQGQSAFIPIEKAVLFRTRVTKDNPEGRSILRNAVIDYYYLKRISNIEAIGIERDMTGLITMEVPLELLDGAASAETKQLRGQFEKMLSELKRDEREFAMIPAEINAKGNPSGYKLKLLSTGGSRQIDTNAVKNYYKTGILQSVFAQFIQLGVAGVGSLALASSQTDLFATALGSFLQIIASTFNKFPVAKLMKLNGVKRELWPELVHGDIETPPLAEIGAYIQALAAAGQLPDDEAIQRKLLEFARLPIPDKHKKAEGETEPEPQRAQGVKKRKGGLKINNSPLRGSTPVIVKGK